MHRKDFMLIADIISRYQRGIIGGERQRESLARLFASELLNSNPRFNTKMFIAACLAEPKEPVK